MVGLDQLVTTHVQLNIVLQQNDRHLDWLHQDVLGVNLSEEHLAQVLLRAGIWGPMFVCVTPEKSIAVFCGAMDRRGGVKLYRILFKL